MFDAVFIDAELLPDARVSLLPDLLPGTAVVVLDEGHGATKVRAGDVGVVLEWPATSERVSEVLSELSAQRAEPRVPAPQDSFWVKTSSGRSLVAVDSIRCLLAYGEYSRIHWGDGQEVLLRKSLKEWETELPASTFLRVHRNSIVNLNYLERVSADSGGGKVLHIKGAKQTVAVSLRKAVELNRRLRPVTLLTTATRLPGHRGILTTDEAGGGTASDC
jgi:DNA-binding LytR/AlgR family response regulator